MSFSKDSAIYNPVILAENAPSLGFSTHIGDLRLAVKDPIDLWTIAKPSAYQLEWREVLNPRHTPDVSVPLHPMLGEHLETSNARRRLLLGELKEAFDEASEEYWDGYGAKPADPRAYDHAQQFLANLDAEFLPDEACVLPGGEMAFDWIELHGGLTLSVGRDGQLAFAGDIGSTIRIKGTGNLSTGVPAIVSCWIKSVRG